MIRRHIVKRSPAHSSAVAPVAIEPLEDRRLLSGSHFGGFEFGFGRGHSQSTIQFSQAPVAVRDALTALASTDQVAAPTTTQTVYLRNTNGLETYTVDITGTGTDTRLTVDQTGKPVTAPTNGTTTFGTLTGPGTGSNAAAANEIKAIATALSLTAPDATTSVRVSTTSSGVSTYTVRLSPASTTTTTGSILRHFRSVSISVDSNGNPVGNQSIPFSAIPGPIQTALNSKKPTGATDLAATSTQRVRVRTANGVTTYSLTFTGTGTQTTVTVNAGGVLTSLPSQSTTSYAELLAAIATSKAAAELQTLATADGVATAIAGTQTVSVYNEGNGTTIYSVTLSATQTSASGQTVTRDITISVDQDGNPTTLPGGGGGGGFRFGGFRFGGFSFGGFGFGRGHGRF